MSLAHIVTKYYKFSKPKKINLSMLQNRPANEINLNLKNNISKLKMPL